METVLVVIRPFAGRVTGDVIEDAQEIRALLVGEHADALVRTTQRSTATNTRAGG